MPTEVLQLITINQIEPGCSSGNDITGILTHFWGGKLGADSSPVNVPVQLSIPSHQDKATHSAPAWVLVPDKDIRYTGFILKINNGNMVHPLTVAVAGHQVQVWADLNKKDPTNQIFKAADFVVTGFAAPITPNGLAYTITTGVTSSATTPACS